MKKASISQAKNQLSSLLDRVRHGQTVIIEDRGIPVARLEPLAGTSAEGATARLERQGLIRRPTHRLPDSFLQVRPPRLLPGRSATAVLLDERSEGR